MLRRQVAAHAQALGMSRRDVSTLKVVFSELATNVVRHGGGTGRVTVWRHGSQLYCQVTDHGPGIPDPNAGNTPPDPTASHGRGLWMCRQMTIELIITTGDRQPGTAVTAVLPLGSTAEVDGHRRTPHSIRTPFEGDGTRTAPPPSRDLRQDHHADPTSHHTRPPHGY